MTALYIVTFTDADCCYATLQQTFEAESETHALQLFEQHAEKLNINYTADPTVSQVDQHTADIATGCSIPGCPDCDIDQTDSSPECSDGCCGGGCHL